MLSAMGYLHMDSVAHAELRCFLDKKTGSV
jgi:hypothetical protein